MKFYTFENLVYSSYLDTINCRLSLSFEDNNEDEHPLQQGVLVDLVTEELGELTDVW